MARIATKKKKKITRPEQQFPNYCGCAPSIPHTLKKKNPTSFLVKAECSIMLTRTDRTHFYIITCIYLLIKKASMSLLHGKIPFKKSSRAPPSGSPHTHNLFWVPDDLRRVICGLWARLLNHGFTALWTNTYCTILFESFLLLFILIFGIQWCHWRSALCAVIALYNAAWTW